MNMILLHSILKVDDQKTKIIKKKAHRSFLFYIVSEEKIIVIILIVYIWIWQTTIIILLLGSDKSIYNHLRAGKFSILIQCLYCIRWRSLYWVLAVGMRNPLVLVSFCGAVIVKCISHYKLLYTWITLKLRLIILNMLEVLFFIASQFLTSI